MRLFTTSKEIRIRSSAYCAHDKDGQSESWRTSRSRGKHRNLGKEVVGEGHMKEKRHCYECVQNGEPLNVTSKGMLTLRVTTCGNVRAVKLTDVYYAADAQFDFVWKTKRKGLHIDA
ncbi:hypothetical protein PC120_g3160 [Phytophthora cactorum]|nr:hypothetical protein PC120_g3160 [Phytophthora cactorum]